MWPCPFKAMLIPKHINANFSSRSVIINWNLVEILSCRRVVVVVGVRGLLHPDIFFNSHSYKLPKLGLGIKHLYPSDPLPLKKNWPLDQCRSMIMNIGGRQFVYLLQTLIREKSNIMWGIKNPYLHIDSNYRICSKSV